MSYLIFVMYTVLVVGFVWNTLGFVGAFRDVLSERKKCCVKRMAYHLFIMGMTCGGVALLRHMELR